MSHVKPFDKRKPLPTGVKHPLLSFDNLPLYPLQAEIKHSSARYAVVAFGRQAGKSFLAKNMALDAAANWGQTGWWLAPTMSAAKHHWEDLLEMIQGFPTKRISLVDRQIDFHSGGSLRIRTAERPDHLRGAGLDFVILDEAAFMASDVWFKIIQPTLTATKGWALIISTPNGRNWFYELFEAGKRDDDEYKSWHAPTWVSPYQNRESLESIRKQVPPPVWDQEYLAKFLADGGGVFYKVEEAQQAETYHAPLPARRYALGVDWGQSKDYSVVVVVDIDRKEQVKIYRFQSRDPLEQIKIVVELIRHWLPIETNIEINNVGAAYFQLIARIIRHNYDLSEITVDDLRLTPQEEITRIITPTTTLNGIEMTNQRKRELIETYAAAITFGTFRLLKPGEEYAEAQVSEMSTFNRIATPAGLSYTYGASEGNHDDIVIAGALAYAAIRGVRLPGETNHPTSLQDIVKQRKKASGRSSPFRNTYTRVRL